MKKSKYFGKHVQAIHGRMNDGPSRPFILCAPDGEAEFGEWLTLKQAESLAKNILKAVAHMRKPKDP